MPDREPDHAPVAPPPEYNRAVSELDARLQAPRPPLRVDKNKVYALVLVFLFVGLGSIFYFGSVRPTLYEPTDGPGRVSIRAAGLSLIAPEGFSADAPRGKPTRWVHPEGAWMDISTRRIKTYPQPRGVGRATFTCVLFGRDLENRFGGEVTYSNPLSVGGHPGGEATLTGATDGGPPIRQGYAVIFDGRVLEVVFALPAGQGFLSPAAIARTVGSLRPLPAVVQTPATRKTAKPTPKALAEPAKPTPSAPPTPAAGAGDSDAK